MSRSTAVRILLALWVILQTGCAGHHAPARDEIRIQPPEELYGRLFYDVQSNDIFEDSKTFVDCVPLYDVEEISDEYSRLGDKSDSSVSRFVRAHFALPGNGGVYVADSAPVNRHITRLWDILKRDPDQPVSGTLIPLPYPYLVPGGRFREIYYWDSYFTMLGLQEDGRLETIQDMIDNFSYLIDSYGFIPNGNRTYYLSRSQPPFYAMMISLLAGSKGDSIYVHYLRDMEKEYDFWMNGEEKPGAAGDAYRNVVMMPGGEILNRYWDDRDIPRSESYREDIRTAREAAEKIKDRRQEDVFRDLRAAAESGWDFSSRWLSPDDQGAYHLYTIHTTGIIPVDLNALLYNLEHTLYKACALSNDPERAARYKMKYEARREAMNKYLWDGEEGFFMDYDFKKGRRTGVYSLAGAYPLFFGIAGEEQADRVAKKIQALFLYPGGVVATTNETGQQWDAPNGWAPLQWITVQGLRNYGHDSLAGEIGERWLKLNRQVYNRTFKMLEKYNVEDLSLQNGGGEYPTQDGFGWTNGVYRKLSAEK